ncbi:MAG: phosphoribosylformylglycinamidine synthase subunit PurQ, partial [Candidatus Micrarchaeota archaeon]
EDRWVILKGNRDSPCIFSKGIDAILVPVRHGEGKFVPRDAAVLESLKSQNRIVFQYVDERGELAGYPYNPNGSAMNIAGICDGTGRIFGMMPHPEAFSIAENCPYWVKGAVREPLGLRIFRNAAAYAEQL